jgi:hypothetical protein
VLTNLKLQMKNKLTLKQLKLELDNLKKAKETLVKGNTNTKAAIGHDIKDSYKAFGPQRLYMKSGGFMLFLITGVLGYENPLSLI